MGYDRRYGCRKDTCHHREYRDDDRRPYYPRRRYREFDNDYDERSYRIYRIYPPNYPR